MRYRKSLLHVRREIVKIKKSILRPYLWQKVGFRLKIYAFDDGESNLGVKANFARQLCFDSFFRFLGGHLGSKIGLE